MFIGEMLEVMSGFLAAAAAAAFFTIAAVLPFHCLYILEKLSYCLQNQG